MGPSATWLATVVLVAVDAADGALLAAGSAAQPVGDRRQDSGGAEEPRRRPDGAALRRPADR
jgi:hypothetical protein